MTGLPKKLVVLLLIVCFLLGVYLNREFLFSKDSAGIVGQWVLTEMQGGEAICFVSPYSSEMFLVNLPYSKLYITDSLFVFPFVYMRSTGNCSFVHSPYFLHQDSLFVDSLYWGTVSWKGDTLVIEKNGCNLFLFRDKDNGFKNINVSELYVEVYNNFADEFVDSMSFYNYDCDYVGCLNNGVNSLYVKNLFMITSFIDSTSYNRIYGTNVYDSFRYELQFVSKQGMLYEIIFNTSSLDIPFELLWLQRFLEKRCNCLCEK